MPKGRPSGGFWTWARVNRVVRRYPVEGASEALAEACGCTVDVLAAKAAELGLEPPGTPRIVARRKATPPPPPPPSPCKIKRTDGSRLARREFMPPADVAGLPAARREPDCPREEARRARARQLARVLSSAPLSRVSLADAGWRHAEAEILREESPEWFAWDGHEWSLAPAGREALLAPPVVIIDAKQAGKRRKARAA